MIRSFFKDLFLAFIVGLGAWVENLALHEDLALNAAESSRVNPDHCLVDRSVLADVKAQKEALRIREQALDQREKELKHQKSALEEEIAKLKDYRDSISLITAQTDAKLEEQTSKLMETLEKMSPKKAAQLISDVNDRLAVAALARVPTVKLSKILNSMDPKRAAKLAQLMTSNDWLKPGRQPSSNDESQSQTKGGEKK